MKSKKEIYKRDDNERIALMSSKSKLLEIFEREVNRGQL